MNFTSELDLQKQIMKSVYEVMLDLLNLPEDETLTYLHMMMDAVQEIIIERSKNIQVIDLGVRNTGSTNTVALFDASKVELDERPAENGGNAESSENSTGN